MNQDLLKIEHKVIKLDIVGVDAPLSQDPIVLTLVFVFLAISL